MKIPIIIDGICRIFLNYLQKNEKRNEIVKYLVGILKDE